MKKYPMLSNWVTIRDYRFGNATVTNELTGRVYMIDSRYVPFLYMLDGKTYPYSLSYPGFVLGWSRFEIREFLFELSAFGIIRDGRYYHKELSSLYRTIYIPKERGSDSVLPKILNTALWLFFLPVFLWGLVSFLSCASSINIGGVTLPGLILGGLSGFFLGGLLHECGHAVAVMASGGVVYEIGVSLKHLIIPGAYILHKDNRSATLIQKIQTTAAGIEVNMIISGIALAVLALSRRDSGFFLMAALVNLLFVLENLFIHHDSDGAHIFSDLFGLDLLLSDTAGHMLRTEKKRRALLEEGCCGKAYLFSYCLSLVLRITGFFVHLFLVLDLISIFT